jgi:Alw26I/Eco31I/Esp3I family type II restriction m6 adenine DNA methyltransferase
LDDLGLSHCSLQARIDDTLTRAQKNTETVDLVLTNPPWDLLKPDSRDAVPVGHYEKYISSIRSYSKRLTEAYPSAVSANGKGMAGYEVNLARAGLLACLSLMREGGVFGIVLPATIFCDQASSPCRRELFTSTRVTELSYFPAETRAFVGVDQPFVTLVGSKGSQTTRLSLNRHNNDLSTAESRELDVDATKGEPLPLSLGGIQSEITERLTLQHPTLRMLEIDMRFGLWLGRELDETRIAEAFAATGIPFLKGRQVGRFEVFQHKSPRINPSLRSIPPTIKERRLAWRDVSRQNQKRRVQAALVPDGWVTGNSLGVGFFRYGSKDHIVALLAVLNSLVFELHVRSRLLTAHVSLGAMRDCPVPFKVFEDESVSAPIVSLVMECTQQPNNIHLAARLEAAVARAYGVDRSTFAAILEAFPKIDAAERAILMKEGWS